MTLHAFTDDALADDDAVAIAHKLRTGQLSADEVRAAAIARARKVDPSLHAIELERFDAPLRTPRPEARLDGVPTFVKDTLALRGWPTGLGSRAVPRTPARSTDPAAKQLLDQGLLVLGKSRMPELGFNASNEFVHGEPTRNPWHLSYSSGASSGGAAALVAAGAVPLAHGNDGGGSIRIPAACCGLVGLKPTRGRMRSIREARTMPIDIVCEGVLTRSVRDSAAFYADAERIVPNRKLTPIGHVEGPGARRLRIGLVSDSITGSGTDADTRRVLQETARLLESHGHQLEPLALPDVLHTFADDFMAYWGMIAFLSERFGKLAFGLSFDASRLDGLTRGLARYYRSRITRTPGMLYRLRQSAHEYARMFQQYDAVLSPVVAHVTPELGYLSPAQPFEQLFDRLTKWVAFTPLNNGTGSPAISLPMGATAEGLPVGVQLSAAHGAERTLLELGFELEAARPFRRIQA
ncbi:MAG: amidase [Polyangiales bacterium]